MYRLLVFLILASFVQSAYAENFYYYNYPTYQTQRTYSRNPFWRNISNYFLGQPTGYTPPVYNNGYWGKSYYNQYGAPYGNRRVHVRNYNNVTGSGITILD